MSADSSDKKHGVAAPSSWLIVESEPESLLGLREELQGAGHAVFCVDNAAEALRLIRVKAPREAILDLTSVSDELESLRLVSALARHVPTVIVGSLSTIGIAVAAVRLGAAGYVFSPASATAVMRVAESGRRPKSATRGNDQRRSPWQVESEYIQKVVADCGGNISEAARQLKMHRRSLQRKLSKRA